MKSYPIHRLVCLLPLLAVTALGQDTKPPATPAAPPSPVVPAPAAPMFVTVGGEVKKPGQLQINESAQLYAVIQSAGGPNEFGSMKKVKIIREGRTIEVNLEDDSQKTTAVMPNDVIEVPKKNLLGN